MPNLIRRLAMKWHMHQSNPYANAEEDPGEHFYQPLPESARARRPNYDNIPAGDYLPDFTKPAPRFSAYGALDPEAPIHRLPTEVILEIASNSMPCSRACLALSSKRLFCVISDGFSHLFDDLRLPAEKLQVRWPQLLANDWPHVYQPERWNFLCLLQKDSHKWLACSDCFVLHPASWFGQTEVGVGPLKQSWLKCRPPELDNLSRNKVPRGIVELCPCIKLTPGKKRTLLAYLRCRHQEQKHHGLKCIENCLPPASGPWWHECRAIDSTGVTDIKLHPSLLANGELGLITEYTRNRNLDESRAEKQLACPHCVLSDWRMNIFFHRSFHRSPPSFEDSCKECVKSRQCKYCSTRVIGATRVTETGSSYHSTVTTERILSDRFWTRQIMFPFPRYTKVLYPGSWDGDVMARIIR